MIDLKLLKESESIELELEQNSKGGTNNYNELDDKPKINGVELQGDLTLEELGIIVNAVKDILINGTSIIDENGNVNIPIADADNLGLVKVKESTGIKATNGGPLTIVFADENRIRNRNSQYNPLVPKNMDYAFKCAMTDGKGAEWTPQEKANARKRMGLGWTLIDTIEVSDVSMVEITFPREYKEFMIIADVKGDGTMIITPYGWYNDYKSSWALPFVDFYPQNKDEHIELIFEKMNVENNDYFKISGFESTSYNQKMKQNLQTTGWFMFNTTLADKQSLTDYHFVKIVRTITSATFKIFAR